jgi:hypothetical protein
MNELIIAAFHDELEKIAYRYDPTQAVLDAAFGALVADNPVRGAAGGVAGSFLGGAAGYGLGSAAAQALGRKTRGLPIAGELVGGVLGHIAGARTFGGRKKHRARKNEQIKWMNRPENIKKTNTLLEENAQKMYNKPLSQLNDREWQSSYDKSLQTMKGLYQQSKEKMAYMTPGGGQARFTGTNYMRGPVSAMQANRMTRMNTRHPMRSLNPMGGSVTAISQPAITKQAEVTYRGITFPGYNKPIPSNRKGKKKMVLVKRGDKIRIVHFGQKGYEDFTQHKDKKRRKNYLTRSAGIRNKSGQLTKDDPFSPNYWARRKLW